MLPSQPRRTRPASTLSVSCWSPEQQNYISVVRPPGLNEVTHTQFGRRLKILLRLVSVFTTYDDLFRGVLN